MPPIYYCILTNKGIEKFAAAAAGGSPVQMALFAVGDSGGVYFEPLATQVSLVAEKWRGPLNRAYPHPNNADWAVFEALIPADQGGWEIREAGLIDAAGDLLAVGKYPLTVKPAPGSGSEKDLYVRMILQVSNAAEVVQQIDPSLVWATKEYVDSRDWRESVRAATTGPIADLAAGAPAALDGVALVQGYRILVKDQAAAAQNGIYVVQTLGGGADGAWVRSADADSALEISANFTVAVEEGTANADSVWMLTTNRPIDLGTTALAFKRLVTQTELDAHTATADPHPQYETSAEAQAKVDAHANRTDNPHGVTPAQIGAVKSTGDNMTGELTIGGNVVWHAGNDGYNSGLGADTWDTYHLDIVAASSSNNIAPGELREINIGKLLGAYDEFLIRVETNYGDVPMVKGYDPSLSYWQLRQYPIGIDSKLVVKNQTGNDINAYYMVLKLRK